MIISLKARFNDIQACRIKRDTISINFNGQITVNHHVSINRHVKNASEKIGENAILINLEKQLCNDFGIDKETFNILVNEEDENIHEKLLNRKLKTMFPDCEKLIDDFRFPESSKDNFEFSISNKTTNEKVTDLVNLTEQDDILLDEGPLKQFLEEDARRNSSSEQTTPNTLEKRHMIISCLQKIDKKEFTPRRVNVVTPRKYSNANETDNTENENQPINNNETSGFSIYNNDQINIKQELDASDSSESDDNAEVDSILTQMELLNPQLFSSEKNKELKREPVDESEFTLNLTSKETLLSSQDTILDDTYENNTYQSLVHPLPLSTSETRYGRINPKSVQAINSEVASITKSSLSDVKHEIPRQNECSNPVPVPTVASNLLAAAAIAEQNRLKNVFKNTICTNIDQFFDLCDACKVYGTEIFNLLEPLLNYLIEKLNPEFNYEKLHQLHSQNISLACGLPFVSSCDHTKNCVECHNLLLSALSRIKVRTADKATETVISKFKKPHHDIPLRQIETGLHDITKEIISLGIPLEDSEIMANDEQMTQRVVDVKHVECQTESRSHSYSHSHSKRTSSRDHRHSSKTSSSRENDKHKSKEKKISSSDSKKNSRIESRKTSLEKHSKLSHNERKSSKSSTHSCEKKRKEDSETDENSSEEEHDKTSKRRRSMSTREQESRKRLSNEKYTSETKRHKSESSSNSSRSKSNHYHHHEKEAPLVETIMIEDSPEREEKAENSDDSDTSNNNNNQFGSDLSDSSSDAELMRNTDKERSNSDNEEEKQNSRSSNDFVDLVPSVSSKKRLSHVTEANSSLVRRKEIILKKNIPTPSEVLFQRMQKSRKDEEKTADCLSNAAGDRVRISHVPNVALLLRAKEQLKNNLYQQKTRPIASVRTIAQTASKGQSRIAHAPVETPKPKDVPVLASNNRPTINSYKGTNNIPLPTRQNGLDRLYNALVKKVPAELASELALKEERIIHEKVTITKVYLNSLAMAIHRIIKEDPAKLVEKNTEFPTELNGFSTYDLLSRHVLTYEQMEINGFPLGIPDQPNCCMISTKAVHYKPLTSKRSGDRFYCLQCKDLFEVDEETGMPLTPSPGCRFHLLRPRKEPGRTRHDVFYPCCNKSISESGCVSSEHHTPDTTDDDCLRGFLETREAPPGEHGSKMFYALDCEMCYTTVGSELTRVTVIGPECNTVYDSLVKPYNKILDYCTKFSGITKEKLRNVTKTLEQVRQELFKFIFKDTILIGHSLENDLKALKILHYKIVDTSVMYPHRDAPERKFALKFLSSTVVQFLIQENEYGHDSKEDALACMKLVWKKIKEDAQLHRPRKIIGSPERNK